MAWLTLTNEEAQAILDDFSSNNNWGNFVYYDDLDVHLVDLIASVSPSTEIEIASKGNKFININQNADGDWQLETQLGVHHIFCDAEIESEGMTLMDVYLVDLIPLYEEYLIKFL